ncbi:caspase family protein [Streptomyces sp. NPDC059853]|uniref:caspase family protein n=1 Tax=Streptomyces sp. NPDC059853 TaxID=3346973 RepID=UPI00365AA9CE
MIHQPRARRSRVLLIGVSEYDKGTGYPSLPSVRANIEQLYDVLVHDAYGRFTPEVVRTLRSPDRETMVREAARAAGEAEDLLLCYFSGHGALHTSERAQGPGRLHLLPRAGSGAGAGAGAGAYGLGYAELRDLLCAGRAERVVLVLDCCYSGNALMEPLPEDRAFALLTSSRRFHGQSAGDGSGPPVHRRPAGGAAHRRREGGRARPGHGRGAGRAAAPAGRAGRGAGAGRGGQRSRRLASGAAHRQ